MNFTFNRFALASLTVITTLTLSSCATSPTGRKQVLLFPESQLSEMGVQAFAGMKENIKISNKPVQNDYVQCIADSITAHVSKDVFAGVWEVVVFDDPQVNAFALPGGKIGVYTGLLEVAVNQHQVAAVMGHEVGHVIAHHGNERVSQSTLIGIGQEAVNVALQTNEVASSQLIMAGLGLGFQYGVTMPFGRKHESEADEIGLELMAKAGFNPLESVELWKNMAKASGGNTQPEFFSTHPSPATRIEDLQANMQAALASYKAADKRPNCQK
ncbi:M48 family metallopeptidase [Brumicola nitratireducens]|uniref:Zn-dependent protease with chaperone function n=1 Tax=Glaciecola nitratireducens (strain JCM 12485 / KCTC 12276 / FR1064) TaxID=1085623 RepID=G4QIB6_GLANF|nr:M48 family metallopeptidase [Glaciecola nitratireducens]AEP30830.1 Zn-dependent protease with chaperone function [Glaciecola nitratireducens FR1064]